MNKFIKKLAPYLITVFLTPNLFAGSLDPLNTAEISNAFNISTPQQRRSLSTNTDDNTELLLIERRPADKSNPAQRLADIYRYDYSRDEMIHTVVDLKQQRIVQTERHQFMQLPLTANEINRAIAIIFKDEEQLGLLRNEYQRITGDYLATEEQLHIKAFSFSATTMPEPLNAASLQCGLNRCAQLLLYTHDAIVFEVNPIVNLSAGIVTQNIGY